MVGVRVSEEYIRYATCLDARTRPRINPKHLPEQPHRPMNGKRIKREQRRTNAEDDKLVDVDVAEDELQADDEHVENAEDNGCALVRESLLDDHVMQVVAIGFERRIAVEQTDDEDAEDVVYGNE